MSASSGVQCAKFDAFFSPLDDIFDIEFSWNPTLNSNIGPFTIQLDHTYAGTLVHVDEAGVRSYSDVNTIDFPIGIEINDNLSFGLFDFGFNNNTAVDFGMQGNNIFFSDYHDSILSGPEIGGSPVSWADMSAAIDFSQGLEFDFAVGVPPFGFGELSVTTTIGAENENPITLPTVSVNVSNTNDGDDEKDEPPPDSTRYEPTPIGSLFPLPRQSLEDIWNGEYSGARAGSARAFGNTTRNKSPEEQLAELLKRKLEGRDK